MALERVLVTGGSGRLGRFVVEELEGHCEVGVLDIVAPRADVAYAQADIRDYDSLHAALAGWDAAIHLAGIDDGDGQDERDYIETNVPGAWNLFHAAEAVGLRKVVVASSTAVLGLGPSRMPDYLPVDEQHPLRPAGAYGLSKQLIETMAACFARRGRLRVVCLRPTLIVRPDQEATLAARLASAASEPAIDIPVTGSYVRSRDVARAFRMALAYEAVAFDTFHVSAADGLGHQATLARLEAVYGRLPEVRDPELYRRDPTAAIFDLERTRKCLGWSPRGDWMTLVSH